jgi:hypothetical protein
MGIHLVLDQHPDVGEEKEHAEGRREPGIPLPGHRRWRRPKETRRLGLGRRTVCGPVVPPATEPDRGSDLNVEGNVLAACTSFFLCTAA